jgi:hypothetical protein
MPKDGSPNGRVQMMWKLFGVAAQLSLKMMERAQVSSKSFGNSEEVNFGERSCYWLTLVSLLY